MSEYLQIRKFNQKGRKYASIYIKDEFADCSIWQIVDIMRTMLNLFLFCFVIVDKFRLSSKIFANVAGQIDI